MLSSMVAALSGSYRLSDFVSCGQVHPNLYSISTFVGFFAILRSTSDGFP